MNTEPQPSMSDDQNDSDLETATSQEQADSSIENAEADSSQDLANELDAAMAEPTIESLQAQLADAEKRVLMAHADLDNFRRRNRRDTDDKLKYAALPLMTQILDALDNFERAIEAHENDPSGEGLVEGVKMVSQQISEALTTRGCKKIEAVGQPFDPNRHQALQMQPSDEYPANTVMQDLRPGFELYDRVIRPSQVFVSTGPTAENE